jgi:methylenetetrahydrofolate reductase (NADPH)
MQIKDIFASKKLTLSFEVFPPKQEGNLGALPEKIKTLAALKPDFISVTCGAGGSTQSQTMEVSKIVAENGASSLTHLTCVNSTKEKIAQTMEQMKAAGIQNILALRGDIPQGMTEDEATRDGYKHADELTAVLKSNGFCVGGACYPEGHPESANRIEDIELLKKKVAAGADFLTTQMFFDNDMLYSFLYRLEAAGIHLPVLAGIMPITAVAQIPKMIKLSNAFIPRKLLAICDRFGSSPEALRQAGIAYATDQIIDLISNGIRGIHIYTMNKPEIAQAILENVNDIIGACNK